ncbi:MAG: trypsin-like peptidase domain-containing protein [Paracoccaceae bacterium]|nr:trypsin-like peptidase domain-containing protein [Paracoccaceae bacterium]MDE3121699.1 trypsin-like peptidase domain-containing protein [Paracoccaceae bacterium]
MRQALALAAALLSVWAGLAPAARADATLTTLDTLDQSRGWEAVGRLNLGDRGFCTATLIAPDKVLTAAHCLYDSATGQRFPVDKLQFLADWRLGRAAAYRSVRRAVTLPGYSYDARNKLDRVAHDLALVELDRPIRQLAIRPIAVAGDAKVGEAVGVVSYARDRADAPSLQRACHVLDRQEGLLVLDCSIDFGSSGAPVFILRGRVPEIVSVISAKAMANGKRVALGAEIGRQIASLNAELASGDRHLVQITTAVTPEAAPAATAYPGASPGAKFVRPSAP